MPLDQQITALNQLYHACRQAGQVYQDIAISPAPAEIGDVIEDLVRLCQRAETDLTHHIRAMGGSASKAEDVYLGEALDNLQISVETPDIHAILTTLEQTHDALMEIFYQTLEQDLPARMQVAVMTHANAILKAQRKIQILK